MEMLEISKEVVVVVVVLRLDTLDLTRKAVE